MKKILFFFVVLASMSTRMYADGMSATLQQGDQMTLFYGADAFQKAYAAADSGAVITLSPGKFDDVSAIAKPIRVVGTYAFSASGIETTSLNPTIDANNVTLEGIYFSTVTINAVTNTHFKRCWLEYLKYGGASETYHTNTLVDECVLRYDQSIPYGSNYCIKNSTLYGWGASYLNSKNNVANIINCVIYCGANSSSSWSYRLPYAIYKNNVIVVCHGGSTFSDRLASPSEFYYNVFTNSYSSSITTATPSFSAGCTNEGNKTIAYSTLFPKGEVYPANPTSPGNGQDGTVIGPYGGTGFTAYPSIPRITSREIDSSTDALGRLNVKIGVTVVP